MSEEVLPKGEEGETSNTEGAETKAEVQQDEADPQPKQSEGEKPDEENGGKETEREQIPTEEGNVKADEGEINVKREISDGNQKPLDSGDAGEAVPGDASVLEKTPSKEANEAPSVQRTASKEAKESSSLEKTASKEANKVPSLEKTTSKEASKVPSLEKTTSKEASKVPSLEKVASTEGKETPAEVKTSKARVDKTPEPQEEAEKFAEEIAEQDGSGKTPKEETTNQEKTTEALADEQTDRVESSEAIKVDGAHFTAEPEVTVYAVKSIESGHSSHIETSHFVTPPTPRISRISYDGADHPQHMEARDRDIDDALKELEDNNTETEPAGPQTSIGPGAEGGAVPAAEPFPEPGAASGTESEGPHQPEKTSFRARAYDEKKIVAAMKQAPPRHEYMGYVFSSQTPRPRGMSNFYLPIVPQPPPRTHICVRGANVPPDVLHKTMRSAPRGLLPLSAVRICWSISPRHTVYTLSDLYAYLTRFGPIEAIYQRCPNSAVVVFCELTAASACVKCPTLGMPWDRLVASYWEPRLANHGYLSRHIREETHQNQLAELAEAAAKEEGNAEIATS